MAEITIAGMDVGNGGIKTKTEHHSSYFPHALFQLTTSQIEGLNEGDSDNPNIYIVNGVHYAIGAQAIRSGAGAVKYGESRYIRDYYGVLAAIGLFRALPKDGQRYSVVMAATHTPKDGIYKNDLVNAAMGMWEVQWQGKALKIRIADVKCIPEPVAHYRHATLYDGGQSLRGPERIRRGICCVIDLGTFTTGFATAEDGLVDYTAGDTRLTGVQDAIDELSALIRSKFRRQLKGAQQLDPIRLRDAIMDGEYDARGLGVFDCAKEAEEACNIVIRDVLTYFDAYGGSSSFDSVLIAGGGGSLMAKRLTDQLHHRNAFLTDKPGEMMVMGAGIGAYKTLQALQAKGKL